MIVTGAPGPTRRTSQLIALLSKRILMARHGIDADRAFDMLRDHSQHNGNKLVDVAETIANSQLLLLLPSSPTPPERPA